jgi:type IV pilus assembly protein PilC
MAIGVAALLITVALPPLVELFSSLGAQLPWTTNLLISIAGFVTGYKLYILVGLVAIIMSIIIMARTPSGKLFMDGLILKTPSIGKISIERNMQQFCQMTSMLLKAGLRLPQVMDITIQTTRNRVVRQALGQVGGRLLQGEGLAQPMADIPLFPRLLVEMVVVGEKTGTMDATLATIANLYEKRVDRKIASLISMIEPTLTIIVGLVVIFIALSMITPLYSILRTMH